MLIRTFANQEGLDSHDILLRNALHPFIEIGRVKPVVVMPSRPNQEEYPSVTKSLSSTTTIIGPPSESIC